MRKIDLTNQRFGKWLVISRGPKRGTKNRWLCRCDCGNESLCYVSDLIYGKSDRCKSCGNTKHGYSMRNGGNRKRIYSIWIAMKQRCNNPKHPRFKDWGGRGIKVCHRWQNSFENFLSDMGELPSDNCSIDRIDNDGDYTPDNCRWATPMEQMHNKRPHPAERLLEYQGIVLNITQWANYLKIKRGTISARIDRGWSIQKIIETPLISNHSTRPKSRDWLS